MSFEAFASPCEILFDCVGETEAGELSSLAFIEATRIEQKYNRYRDDNIVHAINSANGRPVLVDDETSRLLDYAGLCFTLSEGAFDITSGVLRKFWKFDGRSLTPDRKYIKHLLDFVGWDKAGWKAPELKLRPGMEIDLGGIGKEYAVDRVAELFFQPKLIAVMVNFGGDIRAVGSAGITRPWIIGIENPGAIDTAAGAVELTNGAVATSGDSYRYCLCNGVRCGHIIDPRTGWPASGAPQSVTVIADTCSAAGFLATLAVLQGREAEKFLETQGVKYFCRW